MMNAEIKSKWLDALRSGKYKQGKDQLHPTGDTFCCLGVLCDVYDSTGWEADAYLGIYMSSLPPIMREEIGISKVVTSRLIGMNDSEGKTFLEIADYIEKEI